MMELFRRWPEGQLEEIEGDFAALSILASEQVRSALQVVVGHQQLVAAEQHLGLINENLELFTRRDTAASERLLHQLHQEFVAHHQPDTYTCPG